MMQLSKAAKQGTDYLQGHSLKILTQVSNAVVPKFFYLTYESVTTESLCYGTTL